MKPWCTTCSKTTHNTADCWGLGTVAITPADERRMAVESALRALRGRPDYLSGQHIRGLPYRAPC